MGEKIRQGGGAGPDSLLKDLAEKVSMHRCKLGVLQEIFEVPPGCDGYHEPRDLGRLYEGVKMILAEVTEEQIEVIEAIDAMARIRQTETT